MPDDLPEFSFSNNEVTGLSVKPVPSIVPEEVVDAPTPPRDVDPGIDVAYRWAQLYKNDVEYEQFFDWINRRSNPERTDFKQILDSIPIQWGPEQLPPPLRRFFLSRFS